MTEERKGGIKVTIGTVLTVLALVGGPLAVWSDSNRERGKNEQRLTAIEKQEDSTTLDLKLIKSDIQIILLKVTEMEATQRAERQNRREPRDNSRN